MAKDESLVDSALRKQKESVQAYAASHCLEISRDFWDARDELSVTERAGFAALLAQGLPGEGRVILVDSMDLVPPDAAA